MRVENFRIGNYILHPECEPYYFKVEEIKDKYGRLGVVFRNGSCWDSEPEPIELTEEILLNVKGIKEKKGRLGKYYYLEPYSLLRFFFDKNKLVVIKEDFNKSIWLQEVEYLHQFQNIIFALTNKELEINL